MARMSRLATLGCATALVATHAAGNGHAEPSLWRFEAAEPRVLVAPPDGSLTARAATLLRLTGTFGYDATAAVTGSARAARRRGLCPS
jgi:hypothetical protein